MRTASTPVVGDAERIVGAQSSLDVLERHIVDQLAPREGVVDQASICRAAGRSGSSPPVTPSAPINAFAFALVASEVAKPGSV